MKKFVLLILLVCTLLVIGNTDSNANPVIDSSSFNFPTDIVLGDTVDISMFVHMFIIDSSLFGTTVEITILLANDEDTVVFCEGTVEIQLPGILIYEFSCVIPDSLDLGDYNLVIIIQTVFGEFVIEGGHPLTIRGDHDLNQDGSMDISDLIMLVRYMFSGGNAPLPSVSNADFNCDRTMDISDLTTMVNYMFNSGSLPCMEMPGQ